RAHDSILYRRTPQLKRDTLFLITDTASPETYTLSLHDALPIFEAQQQLYPAQSVLAQIRRDRLLSHVRLYKALGGAGRGESARRSEEHTSELQSRSDLVCRLLLEKKNTYK